MFPSWRRVGRTSTEASVGDQRGPLWEEMAPEGRMASEGDGGGFVKRAVSV